MPREKKNKIRKDKRYRRRYHGIEFYSYISDEDAKAKRDEYKRNEQLGIIKKATVADYALPWLERTYPAVADSTYTGLTIHLQHLIDSIGKKQISTIKPSDIKQVYLDHYKNLSNSYIKSAKQLYCSLFDSAVADGICRSNPARDKTAKPHKGNKPKERILTDTREGFGQINRNQSGVIGESRSSDGGDTVFKHYRFDKFSIGAPRRPEAGT